jgi:peptide/nickel transport system permease protein
MTRFIARRLMLTIPVMLLVSIIVFTLINLIPGDPALVFAGNEAGKDVVEALRKQMGLDKPLVVVRSAAPAHGDLGKSSARQRPSWPPC